MNAKTKKILWIAGAVLLVLVAVALVLYFTNKPATSGGAKHITVTVVHKDESSNVFEIDTDEEYLGRAVVNAGIVVDNQGPYGLYALTVDGYTADEGAQEWWNFQKDGESLTTGADETPIADGEKYEIILTVGY